MSTLAPEPTYNPNIPIISSAGGTSVAYKDPNSPESIMKKTTLVHAQGAVDTKYDVNMQAVTTEGFCDYKSKYILYFFLFALLIILFTQKLKANGKLYILSLASLLLALTIIYK